MDLDVANRAVRGTGHSKSNVHLDARRLNLAEPGRAAPENSLMDQKAGSRECSLLACSGSSAVPPSASLDRARVIYTRDRLLMAQSGRSNLLVVRRKNPANRAGRNNFGAC